MKDSEQETLTTRKEIITLRRKGMTNKAIADKLYLSIHTVITTAATLRATVTISPAGLTIYARTS